MRSLKFKFWNKHENKTYGAFTLDEIAINGGMANSNDGHWLEWTGLLDKSGKEIYEGDIVTVRLGGRLANQDGVWNKEEDIKGTLVVEMKGLWWSIAPHWDDELAVIGNVFENPDLLPVSPDK